MQPFSGAFSIHPVWLIVYLPTDLMSTAAFFTKSAPMFTELFWGFLQYSRYREGTEMKNVIRLVQNPKADEATRRRDARTLTLGYEHIAGLAAQLRKHNVAVEQLPQVSGGSTFVSATTGLTWADVQWDGYIIPAELVSQLVDEANAALTERAANLSQGHVQSA